MKTFNSRRILSYIIRHLLTFLPDKTYLRLLFHVETGHSINFSNPISFQEKIQWLKLNQKNDEMTKLVDKSLVKEWVEKKIGNEYIIPTLGEWNNFNEIDFSKLPEKFVLKTTHGGGNTGVVICNNKKIFDKEEASKHLKRSLIMDIYKQYREWPYKNVQRKIIAEKLIEMPNGGEMIDYKIFCFNGHPQYIQVIQNRRTKETIDFFDSDWTHMEFVGLNPNAENANDEIHKPKVLKEMLAIASILSKNFKFVRIDLYVIVDKIYFGEITFYPGSGFGRFAPEFWNLELGKLINL
ncbi:MAG: hypothetical protein NC453_15690 [Muribaculum sp.]|nr:hypothetical protein [Muribaculum sp.]